MNAVCLMLEDRTIYFDIDGTVYTIRGDEAASYFVFENGIPAGYTVTLDGYGGATVTIPAEEEEAEDTVLTGDYVLNDGICAIAILDGETSYVGKLGVYGISGVYYNAFYLQNEQIADAYLDRTDLSVLVLDDIGNVTKYNAYGRSCRASTRCWKTTSSTIRTARRRKRRCIPFPRTAIPSCLPITVRSIMRKTLLPSSSTATASFCSTTTNRHISPTMRRRGRSRSTPMRNRAAMRTGLSRRPSISKTAC